jgi:hypothetical protein
MIEENIKKLKDALFVINYLQIGRSGKILMR